MPFVSDWKFYVSLCIAFGIFVLLTFAYSLLSRNWDAIAEFFKDLFRIFVTAVIILIGAFVFYYLWISGFFSTLFW